MDPRTALALLLVINVVALGNTPVLVAVAAGVVVIALLATAAPQRWTIRYVALAAMLQTVYLVVPRMWTGPVAVAIGATAYWSFRFLVSVGAAAYVVLSVRPAALVAALWAMRLPRTLILPIAVVLRFIPVVVTEGKAILEAMRLRGLEPSLFAFVRRPLASLELVIVPLLAAVSRIADDLTASAMIRGFGGPTRPTSVIRLQWSWRDAAGWVVAVALVVFACRATVA